MPSRLPEATPRTASYVSLVSGYGRKAATFPVCSSRKFGDKQLKYLLELIFSRVCQHQFFELYEERFKIPDLVSVSLSILLSLALSPTVSCVTGCVKTIVAGFVNIPFWYVLCGMRSWFPYDPVRVCPDLK